MKEETAKNIASSLNKFDEKYSAEVAQREQYKQKHQLFLSSFHDLRTKTISPEMEKLKVMLEERGHKCELIPESEGEDHRNEFVPASIKLKVRTKGLYPKIRESEVPFISFFAERFDEKVSIRMNGVCGINGSYEGMNNSHRIELVTTETVEAELATFVDRLFGR